MKIKFSVIAKTLDEAKEQAREDVRKFSGYRGRITPVRANPHEVIDEQTFGGSEPTEVISWEVHFECNL